MRKQPETKSYLTTDNPQNICEGVTIKLYTSNIIYDAFVVTCSQMFISGYYICKCMGCYCMLFDICRYDPLQRCSVPGYYIHKIMVRDGLGSSLSGFLMQLAKYTIHNHISSACLQLGLPSSQLVKGPFTKRFVSCIRSN